jgi:hypothetical protein
MMDSLTGCLFLAFHHLLDEFHSFSLLELSSFWISQKLIQKGDEKLKQTPKIFYKRKVQARKE